MKRLSYILGCAFALTISGTYFVLVDKTSVEAGRLLHIPDAALTARIEEAEDLLQRAGELHGLRDELDALRREQRRRHYTPTWADGRRK